MTTKLLKCGDFVAILPSQTASPNEVLEIAAILFIGGSYIQLLDGRMYATLGGKCLAQRKVSYIVPATEEHFAALHGKETPAAKSVVAP